MVTKYEAQAFAVKHGSRYMETSAKENTGIEELFSAMASSILSHTLKTLKDISLSNNLPQKCSSEDSDEVLMRSGNVLFFVYNIPTSVYFIDKINHYSYSMYKHCIEIFQIILGIVFEIFHKTYQSAPGKLNKTFQCLFKCRF